MTDQQSPVAPAPIPTDLPGGSSDGFGSLGLDRRLLVTLDELGYEEPTPIQRAAIPPLLARRDVLGEAPTGTGKTAAFALPLLHRLAAGRPSDGARAGGRIGALVLVPTRELAIQVSEALHRYGEQLGLRVLPVYGGQAIGLQLRALRRGVDVVVATPGRAVDHVNRGSLRLEAIEVAVLDEADEMLDMGFAEDLETLLSATPAERQTALFSATISAPIARIARRHLREPERVTIQAERARGTGAARVRQVAYAVRRADKLAALGRILDLEDPSSALVFARTRGEVDDLAERLSGQGHDAAALHGGMSQEQRDRVMARFRGGDLDVLVATDVAARGLDIEHVSHVVNFDVPSNTDAYIHRIGRTGRAGREGVAITLVEPREHRLLTNIEKGVRTRLEVGRIPTVADLRERRLELLRASLREALLEDGLERFRGVVEPLVEEFDVVDVALAAVSVADRATARDGVEEAEIAQVSLSERPAPGPRREAAAKARPAAGRAASDRRTTADRRAGAGHGAAARGGRPQAGNAPSGPWTRLYIGGGRRIGLRPADLVGAITGEAGLPGSAIGAIQITDTYSLVEVPDDVADDIVRTMRSATIKGRRVQVRRERER
jgi:ATP-dependent RNA helicase DeaD